MNGVFDLTGYAGAPALVDGVAHFVDDSGGLSEESVPKDHIFPVAAPLPVPWFSDRAHPDIPWFADFAAGRK